MKLSIKKILIEKGYWGNWTTLEPPGPKVKDLKEPEEFPEVFGGPCKTKIKNNHGHKLEISQPDIEKKEDREYNIRGSSDHPHTVKLQKEDFEKLEEQGKLVVQSSEDAGHNHKVIISC